ncbi:hypothetical protein [Aquimarina sp. 2201CG14-23]|uniref:hypothetical protein n=1 Tax=Aquimarina mycalae TaxID=3040073 RepID=UPI002477F52E|nr:hypothetical protein [Aquimarina sp. 2201CG14-23]MDH7444786.1 hypothetical protein [Aquimarina sp. 2201CG14-23]
MNLKRVLFFGLIVFSTINLYSQKTVNDYKYVIVPEGYSFFSENDAYQLNSLSKFLFNKYGFKAFVNNEELPEDLKANGCLGLRADVKKNSGLFLTRLAIELKNCNGIVVFTSKEGKSKEKDYKKAYHEALRDAFMDIQGLGYVYNSKQDVEKVTEEKVTEEKVVVKQPETITKPLEPIAKTNKPLVQEKAKEAAPVITTETPEQVVSSEKMTLYTFNDKIFVFKRQEYGYELLQKNNEKSVSIGKVFTSNRDNSYIIKAGDLSGNGYFDSYGNFILERINPATNKLITDTFARQ